MENKNKEFKVEYFKFDEDNTVYAQIEIDFSEAEYIALTPNENIKKDHTQKHLVIFNDKSGSMSGSPFKALI